MIMTSNRIAEPGATPRRWGTLGRRGAVPLLALALAATPVMPAGAQSEVTSTASTQDDVRTIIPTGVRDEFAEGHARGYNAPCMGELQMLHNVRFTAPKWSSHRELAWSQDGSMLALTPEDDQGGTSSLIIVALADCSWRDLGTPDLAGLSWSPDGTEIATGNRVISATDGTHIRDLGYTGRDPAWHPDGDRIAYRGPEGIHVVAADGSTPPPGDLLIPWGSNPAWSPDGTRIAYSIGGRAAHAAADGTDQVVFDDTLWLPDRVTWSPEGERLLVRAEVFNFREYDKVFYDACVTLTLDGQVDPTKVSESECRDAAWRPAHEPDPTPE
ncbi:hypothetical protein N869_03850, partial [Cellulomonas bogoriensis 69B4 = DSM 16987]